MNWHFILSLVEAEYAALNPAYLHYEHQISLKPEERVVEEDTSEIEDRLAFLSKQLQYCREAIDDIKLQMKTTNHG